MTGKMLFLTALNFDATHY